MNNFFCFILLIFFLSCNGQQAKTGDKMLDTTYHLPKEKMKQVENMSLLELYVSKYVDSVNLATNEEELPKLLNDPQFDYRNSGIWESPHNPISVRGEIVNRVNNCKSLQLIINSKNERFRMRPYIENNLAPPLIELSFFDLVLKRIKSLNCE